MKRSKIKRQRIVLEELSVAEAKQLRDILLPNFNNMLPGLHDLLSQLTIILRRNKITC